MRARAESVADRKETHGSEEKQQDRRRWDGSVGCGNAGDPEYHEADNVAGKAEDHRLAPAEQVGDCAGGYLHQIDDDLAERDQDPDHEKGEPHLPKGQDQERVVVLLVLEKSV